MESCLDLLSEDHSGRGLKALKDELFEMNYSLKSTMDKGLTSEELQIAQGYKNAIDIADEALDKLYKRYNS